MSSIIDIKKFNKMKHGKQRGFGLIEVLVAFLLFSIISLSATRSAIYSIRFQKNAEVGNIARNLAVTKAEQLAGISLDELDNTYGGTESDLTTEGSEMTFIRVTTVTVNGDGSRSIEITVSSDNPALLNPVSYSTRFAPWES